MWVWKKSVLAPSVLFTGLAGISSTLTSQPVNIKFGSNGSSSSFVSVLAAAKIFICNLI